MGKKRERSLFDDEDEEPSSGSEKSEIAFDHALLSLSSIRGLGHKALQLMVEVFGESLGVVFSLDESQISKRLRGHRHIQVEKIASTITGSRGVILRDGMAELNLLTEKSASVISPSSLPDRLRSLGAECPKWLIVQGNKELLYDPPAVAVVGTRKPSATGIRATNSICHILSAYPIVLVSGLADGIDAEAHESSLRRGMKNVAFLGHGINHIFPEQTAEIRKEIIRQGGAVVSEYVPSQTYQKQQFVERNRLQAALSDIVIPVEAASASGTAHTARFARKYEKQLLGVRWSQSTGLVDDLAANNEVIIDAFDPMSLRYLDGLIQKLLEKFDKPSYPFQPLERHVIRELKARVYNSDDISVLLMTLQRLAEENQSGHP